MKRLLVTGLIGLAGHVFTMCEGAKAPAGCCNSPDKINMVMDDHLPGGTRGAWNRCLDYGGKPVVFGDDHIFCEDLDY